MRVTGRARQESRSDREQRRTESDGSLSIDSIAMTGAADVAGVDGDSNTTELKRFYYHYDGRTNVARLTDPDEAVVESHETDPYGQVTIADENEGSVFAERAGRDFES